MKKALTITMVLGTLLVLQQAADADVYVRGYVRSNGTYVSPHFRSNPDGILSNNWSTYPNVNPYTGDIGTKRNPCLSDGGMEKSPLLSYGSERPSNYFNTKRHPSLINSYLFPGCMFVLALLIYGSRNAVKSR
jgi:hypothetical protein